MKNLGFTYMLFASAVVLSGCGGGSGSTSSVPPAPLSPESPNTPTPATPSTPEPEAAVWSLNDTGQILCGDYAFDNSGIDNNDVDCALSGSNETTSGFDLVPLGQDATYGRDADPSLNDDADGHAGFSFTKLDGVSGGELAANATDWACVRDNVTGLIWEVKTNDGGLRDKDHFYSWYNSTGVNDGGEPGTPDAADQCANADRCDTEKYVADINAVALCGYSDWRLPTPNELLSISDLSRVSPAIDTRFFPNAPTNRQWTSATRANSPTSAFAVYGDAGTIANLEKSNGVNASIRLVRDAQ